MAKSLKPKGEPTTSHKTLQNEKRIDLKVKEAILNLIEDNPDFLQTVIVNNPNLISQYLPKAKDTDQSLIESHLSLVESYEHLPDQPDLTERIRLLELEIHRISVIAETERIQNLRILKPLKSHPNPDVYDLAFKFVKLLEYFIHRHTQYYFDLQETPVDLNHAITTLQKLLPNFDPQVTGKEHLDRLFSYQFDKPEHTPPSKSKWDQRTSPKTILSQNDRPNLNEFIPKDNNHAETRPIKDQDRNNQET